MDAAYRYRATCERVIDGDTFVLRVDLGFRVAVSLEGRLSGVDAPEMSTAAGKAARAFAVGVLGDPTVGAEPLIVESHRDQRSFARWIVDVYVGGESFADLLVAAGHGTRL